MQNLPQQFYAFAPTLGTIGFISLLMAIEGLLSSDHTQKTLSCLANKSQSTPKERLLLCSSLKKCAAAVKTHCIRSPIVHDYELRYIYAYGRRNTMPFVLALNQRTHLSCCDDDDDDEYDVRADPIAHNSIFHIHLDSREPFQFLYDANKRERSACACLSILCAENAIVKRAHGL